MQLFSNGIQWVLATMARQMSVPVPNLLTAPYCTHISFAEVDSNLPFISDLRKHGGSHEQVREAVHVQVNCTQGGAEVRAHLQTEFNHDNMFRGCS